VHEFHIEFHVVFLCTYLLSGNEVDEGNGFPAPPLASGNWLDYVSFCLLIYFLDRDYSHCKSVNYFWSSFFLCMVF